MSIPTYSLLLRRRQSDQFPPSASDSGAVERFDFTYVGNRDLQRRVAKALRRYAATQFAFWKFPIATIVLGIVGYVVISPNLPGWFPWLAFPLLLIAMSIVPIQITWLVGVSAKAYANPNETYGASYPGTWIVWKVGNAVYRFETRQIGRIYAASGITVLGIRGSRAICVLPDELVNEDVRAKLANRTD